ncbi:hypothetical protein HOC01_05910 [archaeon]|mgnify:FL=1|jgi:hypothetical protein|nr:hypothetical protein [archaeon]MBT6697622.1 hypothetical protein [archaeon]
MVDFSIILTGIITGFSEISKAPFQKLEIWWYLFPIISLWFILEIYFGEHKTEKMGWNTALANGFSLSWVTIESMRVLFAENYEPFTLRFIIILLVLMYSAFTIYVAFTHKFKDKIAFAIAGNTPIYFTSAVLILWSHDTFSLGLYTIIDLLILFGIALLFSYLLRKFLPEKASSGGDDHEYEKMGFDDNSSSSPPSDFSSPNQDSSSPPSDNSSDNAFSNMFS